MSGHYAKLLRALVLGGLLGLAAACAEHPTLLDTQEETYDIKSNDFGANHRTFHKVLHYPHGNGLRIPGYIVGIEKANQEAVQGPKLNRNLVEVPSDGETTTSAYSRLMSQSKAHLVTHVMKYAPATGVDPVFPGRIRPCALYSLLDSDGGFGEGGGAAWHDDAMARQIFPECPDAAEDSQVSACDKAASLGSEFSESKNLGAFEKSWRGIAALCKDLRQTVAGNGFSHILVVVMGWNTPQDNAVENYNSLLGHLLDEVESRRRKLLKDKPAACRNPSLEVRGLCEFKPLVIGVSWASDWELSPLLPIPTALVRLVSFPNKANDAKEVGITWLNAILHHSVLPAREAAEGKKPKVVIVGHSFGARATLAALTQPAALAEPISAPVKDFADGDLFLALQGAFRIEELFRNEDPNDEPWPVFEVKKPRAVLTASLHDSANETAFWAAYAGMIKAHQEICEEPGHRSIACITLPSRAAGTTTDYGFSICEPGKDGEGQSVASSTKETEVGDWRKSGTKPVLYVDATAMMNCRAAFTGGGSHSDIYRRETARFIWDLIR